MPLSWNEITDRALRFSREWAEEGSEDAEAKSFWDGFFDVFGVPRRRVATFEERVKRIDGRDGYIDLLWKGVLLVEHKSRGRDLDRAHQQARDYFHGLTDAELPKYLLVSDFERFRLYDLEGASQPLEFLLRDLSRNVRSFGFIAGYQSRPARDEDPVNIEAAERMGRLHDALKAARYTGHALEVLLVRILFCLFADDTGIFAPHTFHELLSQRTSDDGANLGQWLAQLFQTLNTEEDERQHTLDVQVAEFPYVNGRLFAEPLPMAAFDARMRELLLDASSLDWSLISPAIFGSMFQSVMDAQARRNLGAHYTSEANILKLIEPLFLDELRAELARIGDHEARLRAFHSKLARLKFLDPACGCGNFLVIAYREIRLLELEVLTRLYARQGSVLAHVADHVLVDVDQFYGIEIEEFPAQIAQVAMWLMDHQMNLRVAERFGEYFARLPLRKSATIVNDNALRLNWDAVLPSAEASYVLGNPPFLGHHYQSEQQKADQALVLREIPAHGVLDFVSNWYVKAADYMRPNAAIRCAFVSTSSITQGEQVGLLWPLLLRKGVQIHFAHRSFQWSSEGRGAAAVHCVIVGFALQPTNQRVLFDYATPRGPALAAAAANINPYLVDAPDVVLTNRTRPISDVPKMKWGNKPTDGGHLILSPGERDELLRVEPQAARYVRQYMSGGDFINGDLRYCLWLVDADPEELRALPSVMARVAQVRASRLESTAESTRAFARYPTLFRQIAQPDGEYLAIPEVSSERREYIPIAFVSGDVICSNKIQFVPNATRYHLGVLHSTMHMAWVRAVCGRLESRLSYSNTIVYNNFPWPQPTDRQRESVEQAASGVLDARAAYPDATLAALYDPDTMPPPLRRAHEHLDRAVDAAYGRRSFRSEGERVAFLFQKYQELSSMLPVAAARPRRARVRDA